MVQGLSNSIVQVLSRPRRDPTKFPFEPGPQLLDRVIVRTVRRQWQNAGTCTHDRRAGRLKEQTPVVLTREVQTYPATLDCHRT
jgi:hypothetical protein